MRQSAKEKEGYRNEETKRGRDIAKPNPDGRKLKGFLFSPEELRITLGERWQKGERERRRFSSCER